MVQKISTEIKELAKDAIKTAAAVIDSSYSSSSATGLTNRALEFAGAILIAETNKRLYNQRINAYSINEKKM